MSSFYSFYNTKKFFLMFIAFWICSGTFWTHFVCIYFSNYPERVIREYKIKGKEVNKVSNVAEQDSSKLSSFVVKEREIKVVKKCIKTREKRKVTQLLT